MFDTGIVDQEPGLEIVRAVQDQVHAADDFLDVQGIDVRNKRVDLHLPVHQAELRRRRHRLGQPLRHVFFVEQDLALQVVEFDVVAIDDPDIPDARSDQMIGENQPQGTAANHGNL